MEDLPFVAEYAKSSRASCKSCQGVIEKDTLRMGIMIQSSRFDGRFPLWHHFSCFWSRAKVKSESDVKGFDNLRWNDQEKVRQAIAEPQQAVPSARKEKPVKNEASLPDISALSISCGTRSAKCASCAEACEKGKLRIVLKLGKQNKNHHPQCFANTYSSISGFESLSEEEKDDIKRCFTTKKRKGSPDAEDCAQEVKKTKQSSSRDEERKLLKIQSDEMWKVRDMIKNNLTKADMLQLFKLNNQQVPSGETKILDRLTDCVMFGALKRCQQCNGGQLVYSSTFNAYICTGSVSGWTRCTFTTRDPERCSLIVPEEEQFKFLSATSSRSTSNRKRIFPTDRLPSSNTLKGVTVFVRDSDRIEAALEAMGAQISSVLDNSIMLAVVDKEVINADRQLVSKLAKYRILTVSNDFVDALKSMHLSAAILAAKIGDWESDNIEAKREKLASKPKRKRRRGDAEDNFSKPIPSSSKLLIKRGGAVEPDSGLADIAHVYQDTNGTLYNAVLHAVDVQRGQNSYYKMQVLKHDSKEKYWLFRSWGRVGTTIGDSLLEKYALVHDALSEFKKIYAAKTANEWDNRAHFVKYPSKFVPVEIDYETEKIPQPAVKPGSKTNLPKEVQELIMEIFDIEKMKETMAEFSIDLTKMPLGKISREQIERAFSVLAELQEVLKGTDDPAVKANKITNCTTRFYSLVPHNFGMRKPPLLDSTSILQKKVDMLENMREIEIAYSILQTDYGDEDPLDVQYEKLKADIKPLDITSSDFEMICRYVKNTHGQTHSDYTLAVQQVYVIDRLNEQKRYRPFKKLQNRMLLWHGSRNSNYAGILCQGLRIAPPEAPVTGYMFGKGIYFADMVTKSANYCYATKDEPYGYLLLCEVALGNVLELKNAKYLEKLPTGKHSVKGIGETMPDPAEQETTDDGVVIPLGKPVASNVKKTSLLYNEYIVYDISQLHIKFLVKLKFNFK
ncbi:Poly(ADP-ribose) polymerase catalytic domain protein [Trichuris suis]|nr:Poly(ADP-ribose) polymerase catalytic domain protein [Trichuris suis]